MITRTTATSTRSGPFGRGGAGRRESDSTSDCTAGDRHGAAPFDDPEVVALCRALARKRAKASSRRSRSTLGLLRDGRCRVGALRYALLSTEERRAAVAEMAAARPYGEALPEEATMLLERLGAGGLFEADDDSVELWIDVVFFLLVFGVLCALSAALRRACSLANRSRRPQADRQADDAVARLLAEDDRERKARLKRTGRTPRGRSPRAKPNGSSVPTTTRSPSPSATASDASSSEAEMPDLPLRGGKPSRPAARPKSARDASGSKRGGPLKPKKVPKEPRSRRGEEASAPSSARRSRPRRPPPLPRPPRRNRRRHPSSCPRPNRCSLPSRRTSRRRRPSGRRRTRRHRRRSASPSSLLGLTPRTRRRRPRGSRRCPSWRRTRRRR